MLDNERRRPGSNLIAIDFPNIFARRFVDSKQEGGSLVIPKDEDFVTMEYGGTSLPKTHSFFHVAEVSFPNEIAVHVETVETARAEVGIDMLSIRDG